MSQDRQNPDHSNTGRLNIRIIGRTKEYEINKVIGETEERLKVRIAEAVNTHPGSLNDEAVTIEPNEVEYIRVRGGSFVTQVRENHWQLSVKLATQRPFTSTRRRLYCQSWKDCWVRISRD